MSLSLKRAQQQLGIIDLQVYFPKYFVDQVELEQHDKASKGKYTIGLGQERMAFVKDNEDINSITLNTVEKIIKRNNISFSDIGRLEIGTETFLDKSKSIKTHIMELFKESGNMDIEGVTNTNACYGGTNALLNAINWLYSDFYDGRYAIVVCSDIAIYSKGAARPTGGCGSVAILLGPNASIEIEKVRSTYMNNVYDFYKPDPVKEYPTVDGGFSIDCYFKALEYCYKKFLEKTHLIEKNYNFTLNNYDYFCFHSPFSKMVEKAFYQLISYDVTNNNNKLKELYLHENNQTKSSSYLGINLNESNNLKGFENLLKIFEKRKYDFKLDNKLFGEISKLFKNSFKNVVEPALVLGKNLGNIYTGSLYIGFLSLILNEKINLSDKKILMFSYGSGCAASMFGLKVHPKNLGDYTEIRKRNHDVIANLNSRIKISPPEYEIILSKKEKLYLTNNYVPEANRNLEELFDDSFYLEKVDEKWRRLYTKKISNDPKNNLTLSYNRLSNKTTELNFSKNIQRLLLIRNQLKN